ncbi:MAG TPA: protoglobin domain-containing protein [Candidatus Binatia bacterium]|nr:protoglobin domain-containing protein [Candidatus Binatia bacterium]
MSSRSSSADPPGGARPDDGPLHELRGLDAARRADELRFFEIGPEDEAALRRWRALAESTVDDIVADFYAHLLRFPEMADLLQSEPGRIAKLQGLQREYFLSLSEGRFDADYFESRLRVGDAHQRIGVRPVWYIGAFALYLRLALRTLVANDGEGARLLPTIEALIKAIFLDMSLAMNTYIYGGFVDRTVAGELERAARVAEEALAARAEVETLKTDLTNMVVHDLKNPVNGIAMMVQLALRKGRELPETQKSYLLQIDRTCREMMRLIQNLLEISKIEEGKMPVAREPLVLAEVVDEVAREYEPVAEQAGRQLRVDVGTGLPAVIGDRALLKRVLANLVVNALRHSGSREVVIEGRTVPGQVIASVIDYGHGIAAEDQGRIFEKFRAVRRSPSDDPGGDTGLGLPFCKLAVERMGGRITLASTPGVSTAFTVTLPALETS